MVVETPTTTTMPSQTEATAAAAMDAARHLCEEARVVLTSLRGGPPNVARGDLAQDLQDLRGLVKYSVSTNLAPVAGGGGGDSTTTVASSFSFMSASHSNPSPVPSPTRSSGSGHAGPATTTDEEGTTNQLEPPTSLDQQPPPAMVEDVGVFSRPFLAVVMDPRAAGPHTLVALRSLHRLLERGSLEPSTTASSSSSPSDQSQRQHGLFTVALEPLTKGVLNCKFEQTDAGADEAVEMAIADLLALLVQIDRRALRTDTLMDAFNTVFVTRNTFVHSPALCYHFEDVLTSMIQAVFEDLDHLRDTAGKLMLEFLVNQLLHTPLVGGDDDASREAQMAHDATRVLCLRLTRTALRTGLKDVESEAWKQAARFSSHDEEERSLLQIIQDDLCLSLLMTGQAIWAYQDNPAISPGFISMEVLQEICATLSTLWTSVELRKHLVSQFEAIFTGFYQRALVLLRKRSNPPDSMTFHANLIFDAGVETILESLADIMGLHDHRQTVAEGNGGSLETLFSTYDCSIRRSDVAVGLMVELCRCSGSRVDEDGDILQTSMHEDMQTPNNSTTTTPVPSEGGEKSADDGFSQSGDSGELVMNEQYRLVPPHLKELCAECIIGGMQCLFQDDHASETTRRERHNRQSILVGHVSPAPVSLSHISKERSVHHLRNIKSKKRLMRKAAVLFNKKASKGIDFLASSGIIASPVTPRSVASFLRNGIVVGLDKRAVGAYLGEVGKGAEAQKSPPVWERDWFHKECLETYCNLFKFERQSLLDGLRMFLASFRLPGEAQQIDRILQAFSDSCGRVCEEGAQGLKLFSEDPKKASDAAYLLSFSIIMLNTDQHNDNIREDRKMSKKDFIKNNSDYGRDITEPGKELPPEYLGAIYDSIREEEIRTEGEGADGSMTVERWKDVLRGSSEEENVDECPSATDAEDLTELVLEHVWMPIMSTISALWGVKQFIVNMPTANPDSSEAGTSGMLGAQSARLGMDMAWDMLVGVRQLGRNDIFCKIFNLVCKYSGLLDYVADPTERAWSFSRSVEAQSAFVVALRVARDANDEIGVEGWKRIWLMLFELRDLKMLGGGVSSRGKSILLESDPDLLKDDVRRDWSMKLIKKGKVDQEVRKTSSISIVFRSLFGSAEEPSQIDEPEVRRAQPTIHGKENHIIWDELAQSDDEDEDEKQPDDFSVYSAGRLSLGAQFENQLIQEDLMINQQREMPVTGLERVEDAQGSQVSPRGRVRKRLVKSCDYAGLISESRFMDDEGICNVLQALFELIPANAVVDNEASGDEASQVSAEEFSTRMSRFPISPASEAFAEVLICELVVRNRDRLTMLWHNHLKSHYYHRLRSIAHMFTEGKTDQFAVLTGSMEKCVSGLLRISCCAVQRGDISNDILETWTLLDNVEEPENQHSLLNSLDKHIGEGLWRITRCLDDATLIHENGWKGILSLINWCADRGCKLPPIRANVVGRTVGLAEDDPALQAYRSVHFLLNVSEVRNSAPPSVVNCIRKIVAAGHVRNCPKLSIAGLDLLQVLSSLIETTAVAWEQEFDQASRDYFWQSNWRPVLAVLADASGSKSVPGVRQHSLSILTDSFLDKRGGVIPINHLCDALGDLCIPLAGKRIVELREGDGVEPQSYDEVMIELELCIGLIFKPLRHHLQNVVNEGQNLLLSLWTPILGVLQDVLKEPPNESGENGHTGSNRVIQSTNELTIEHLRNVIMVLISIGVLQAEPQAPDDLSAITWEAVSNMDFCKNFLEEWKQAALNPPDETQTATEN